MNAPLTHKTVKKMLADHDPVSWLAAADMIAEAGVAPYDDEAIRSRALMTLAVAAAMKDADARRRGKSRYPQQSLALASHPTLAGRRYLLVSGAAKRLLVTIVDGAGRRVSVNADVRRDLLARPDYLIRRAAELADGCRKYEERTAKAS